MGHDELLAVGAGIAAWVVVEIGKLLRALGTVRRK
jgi:hypothetical protein